MARVTTVNIKFMFTRIFIMLISFRISLIQYMYSEMLNHGVTLVFLRGWCVDLLCVNSLFYKVKVSSRASNTLTSSIKTMSVSPGTSRDSMTKFITVTFNLQTTSKPLQEPSTLTGDGISEGRLSHFYGKNISSLRVLWSYFVGCLEFSSHKLK